MTQASPPGASRRVTIEDVASRAGVSRSLVSIVLRDAPGASPVTREKVHKAAQDLGYRRDVRARALASASSGMVGVVFGTAGSFHFDLLEGLYSQAHEHGYSLILSALTEHRDEAAAIESLHDFRIDAMVMLGPATEMPILAGRMPVVTVSWPVDHPDVDAVRTSDDGIMELAVSHLVELGHQRIAHIDGGPSLIARNRAASYAKAMESHGLGRYIRFVPGGETMLGGQRAAHDLLASRKALPTALMGFNDDVAAAAMIALQASGVDVPGEVSVIGIDDSALGHQASIGLTSVKQDTNEIARRVILRVEARHRNEPVTERDVVLQPTLTVRTSTGAPRLSKTG